MRLTAQVVIDTVGACLFSDNVPREEMERAAVRAHGVCVQFGFDPVKIKDAEPAIRALFAQLPEKFIHGASFLEMCMDREGRLWTGDHARMDELLCLGLATGIAEYCIERSFWECMPGGVPYLWVRL